MTTRGKIDTTPSASKINTDDQDHGALDAFQSEIARMSEDTDAILDSIRQAVQPTPSSKRSRRSLPAMIHKHSQFKRTDGDENDEEDEIDDDMTDDGSVPEEVKQKIQDELSQVDTKFYTDPDGISEEIRRVSMQSLSPLAAIHHDEEIIVKHGQNFCNHVASPVGETIQLAVQAFMVWLIIFAILVRAWQMGLLDENGRFLWPFAFSTMA